MKIQGTVKVVHPEEAVSATFKKRLIVVETDEKYPQTLAVEFTQDKTGLLDKFGAGQKVEIDINLRGREWVDPATGKPKYFTSINGWRICELGAAAPVNGPSHTEAQSGPEDDLPF